MITALLATAVLPVPNALLSQLGGDGNPYRTDSASAQTIPAPNPNCTPLGPNVVPAGQANPSDEPEPMGPVWCFPLVSEPTTRTSGANDWVDSFETNVQMGHLNDGEMGYRVFEAFNGDPGTFKQQTFVNNNHWMVDLAKLSSFNLSGGVMLTPNRSFQAENGRLVIEADVAAGADGLGGADEFVEIDLTSASAPTGTTVDPLYGYGKFGRVGAVGCRLERQLDGAHIVCAMYDDTARDAGGTDVTGGPIGRPGRVWETQGAGTANTAASVVGGYPSYQIPGTNLRVSDVWRQCEANQMDMFCRDRFRLEITKTSVAIFVNGYRVYDIQGLFAENPATGADNRIPDAFLSSGRPYFTSWNNGTHYPVYRFHWGRVAVNPHNIGGAAMPASAAPSFCLGAPQNTCMGIPGIMPTTMPMPMPGGNTPTMTPMPDVVPPTATRVPVAGQPTATRTPVAGQPIATAPGTAVPTATPQRPGSPTQMSVPQPASMEPGRRVTFDDISTGPLAGRYPSSLIDWGSNQWRVWPRTGRLDTDSLKFDSSGMTSASFGFVSPKRLTSLRAYNQGTVTGTLTLSCSGQPTRRYVLAADQLVTLDLGWTGACSTVEITSSVGWLMKFDDLMVYDN
jgi:hypothetical protein